MLTGSLICVYGLIIIAAIVAIGLMRKKNMWKFIICYWIVLVAKNVCDLLKL